MFCVGTILFCGKVIEKNIFYMLVPLMMLLIRKTKILLPRFIMRKKWLFFFNHQPNTYFHSTNLMHILRNGLFKRRQKRTRSACSIVAMGFLIGGLRVVVAFAAANALFQALPWLILIFIAQKRLFI